MNINTFFGQHRAIILIILFSFTLQIFFIFNYKANGPVELDAASYNTLAQNLLRYKIYSTDGGQTHNIRRAPVYPFFIFLIYLFFGEKVIAVQIAQVILAVLACLLIYKIGCMVFDRRTAILAAFMAAIHPVFICQSFYLVTELLAIFLITLAVYLALYCMRSHKIVHFILLGLILAITALCRPTVLLLPFFAVSLLLFYYNLKKTLRFAFFFLATFAILVGLWTYRNYKLTGYIIPVQSTGGGNIWLGTYVPGKGYEENARQESLKLVEHYSKLISIKLQRENNAISNPKVPYSDIIHYLADKEITRDGIKNILNNPFGFIKILPYKFFRLYIGSYCFLYGIKESFGELWHSRNMDKGSYAKLIIKVIIILFSLLIITFALMGLAVNINKTISILPLFILFIYWNLFFVFFDTMTRYSIPILPILILMAARGIYFVGKYL